MTRIDSLIARLGDIPSQTNEKAVRAKSRDFFWYSPVLKEQLDHVTADIVVSPRNEAEVLQVLAACYALDLPVTPRGGGTGNYAQAMPLAGGVVLDMTRMTAIREITAGQVICEPGILIGDLETATKATGQELRMHPSTRETATIGGFISGGSGGVGSIHWGMLYEPGNILKVRVATMEAEPKVLELTGEDINLIHHAYGVTGVMTEVEMPLAPALDWVEALVAFPDWRGCVEAGWDLAQQTGLWLKQLAAIEAPAPFDYFTRHQRFLKGGDNLLCLLIAPNAVETVCARMEQAGGRMAFRSDKLNAEDRKGLPHMHHLCWNHTTLRALKAEPEITYLQLGTRDGDPVGSAMDVAEMFPDEIINHMEFTRGQGRPRASMLPMLRWRDKARFDQMITELAGKGIINWNPHAYSLEEGNHRDVDPAQVAFKRAVDPKGLLNPGKLIGWENPDYRYDPKGGYRYSGIQPVKAKT